MKFKVALAHTDGTQVLTEAIEAADWHTALYDVLERFKKSPLAADGHSWNVTVTADA